MGTFSAYGTCLWQKEVSVSLFMKTHPLIIRTPLAQQADHPGLSHTISIFQHLRQGADHQLPSDAHSATRATNEIWQGCSNLMNLCQFRAEIELLADVIFCM
ncbi:unnamed protein product [Prunus brigantina]